MGPRAFSILLQSKIKQANVIGQHLSQSFSSQCYTSHPTRFLLGVDLIYRTQGSLQPCHVNSRPKFSPTSLNELQRVVATTEDNLQVIIKSLNEVCEEMGFIPPSNLLTFFNTIFDYKGPLWVPEKIPDHQCLSLPLKKHTIPFSASMQP